MAKRKTQRVAVINEMAAGIDIGSKSNYVAIGQGSEDVKEFGVYTEDLHETAKWLVEKGMRTVAMESTGTYWQQLFIILQDYGLEVILVNGRFTKNVKGKKTDVQDCQWIQKLHTLGMLEGSFLPDNATTSIREYVRHRKNLLEDSKKYKLRMQKAMRLMNVRLDNAINDITGKSGRAIISAILDGERDATALANLADWRVKKSKEEIAKALTGNWRDEYLFELKQSHEIYYNLHDKIAETERELEKILTEATKSIEIDMADYKPEKKKINKDSPKIMVEKYAFIMSGGVDLTKIPAISRDVVLTIMSEIGFDLSAFSTVKHFTSWLSVSPNPKITGGKVKSSHTPKRKNRVSEALQNAANVIGNMRDNPLSEFFHRLAFKKGRAHAITATARKLGVIIYNMLTKKQQYMAQDNEQYKEQIRLQRIKRMQKQISKLEISQKELFSN